MKIKKKAAVWLIGVCAAVMVWGCGSNVAKEETKALSESSTPLAVEQKNDRQESEEDGETGPGEQEEPGLTGAKSPAAVEVFAEKIQEAVADKDMEALADLTEFPLTLVSTDKEKIVIADREEFLKQNPDMIFGDDLMIAVANVDTAVLSPEDDTIAVGDENSFLLYREIGDDVFAVTVIQE